MSAGGARGGKARLELDQMSRKALPCKACVEHPKGTCFAARSDYFRAARRHKNNDILSGCRKSPSLAWESVTPVPCLSLWERWPSVARTERANKEGPPPGGLSFSLSINILHTISSSSTQGELEGAKPASNKIKCRAKPCLARRAWSEATIFVPQGGTKITTLFQAVEKAGGFFRQPERAAMPPSLLIRSHRRRCARPPPPDPAGRGPAP